VILAGVMLKLGTYGFVRFGLYLFPDASLFFAPVIATLGVIGILYGAVVATMQKDIKRLVAYSSVAHLGFIALGTFAMTTQGIGGGVLQMVNHGISTGALFLLLGMLYERRHTYDIAAMSGLQKAAPVLAGVFTLVMLSSIGLPGLNGFVGEFLVLAGAYLTLKWWAVAAAAGVILAALYLLWAYQRVFHGEPTEEDLATPDMRAGELAYMLPLLGLIVFLGVVTFGRSAALYGIPLPDFTSFPFISGVPFLTLTFTKSAIFTTPCFPFLPFPLFTDTILTIFAPLLSAATTFAPRFNPAVALAPIGFIFRSCLLFFQ